MFCGLYAQLKAEHTCVMEVLLFRHSARALPPSTPKLFELASTCVQDFDEDKAEEEKPSQYTINTFEAIERSIKQSKGPCPPNPKREQMRLVANFSFQILHLPSPPQGRNNLPLHHIVSLTDRRDDEAANPAQKAGT